VCTSLGLRRKMYFTRTHAHAVRARILTPAQYALQSRSCYSRYTLLALIRMHVADTHVHLTQFCVLAVHSTATGTLLDLRRFWLEAWQQPSATSSVSPSRDSHDKLPTPTQKITSTHAYIYTVWPITQSAGSSPQLRHRCRPHGTRMNHQHHSTPSHRC
jgi:hypothetical protein